ncbi:MAG: DnaJ C-terminal domain-containing protein [Pseudomonadota bacterium]
MAKDPYAVLGVSRKASEDEIRSAHRRLVKELHPDLHPGDESKATRFKAVSSAFEIVGDPQSRAKFDRGEIDADGNPTAPFGGKGPGAGFGGPGADPFEDILSGLFGGGRARRRTGPVRGRDVRYQVEIAFEDAVTGARRKMSMADGRTLEVDIPPGIETGQTLRLKSQGMASAGGGPPGDALLQVAVKPSRIWQRDGLTLRMRQSISLEDAVLGGKIDVATPSGPVSLSVPAGSNSGTVMRLKGKGVTKGKTAGDLLVELGLVLDNPKDPELLAFLKGRKGA